MTGNTINFIHKDLPLSDRELFFGPLDSEDKFVEFDNEWQLEHIFVNIGLFKSLTQARKNASSGLIPAGFSSITRGKNQKKIEIFILNKWY